MQGNFFQRLIPTEQKEGVPFPCAHFIAGASLGAWLGVPKVVEIQYKGVSTT